MNVEPRTVQRSLAKPEELGLMHRVTEEFPGGEERRVCDSTEFKRKLEELRSFLLMPTKKGTIIFPDSHLEIE
jgi:hypothetical protein